MFKTENGFIDLKMVEAFQIEEEIDYGYTKYKVFAYIHGKGHLLKRLDGAWDEEEEKRIRGEMMEFIEKMIELRRTCLITSY